VHRSPGLLLYEVRHGETLGGIAQLVYGHVDDYRLIYDANLGREQPDGLTFTESGQIFPRWTLVLPDPARAGVEVDGDGTCWYTVRKGDSLAAISRRFLGSGARWPELFELNKGAQTPEGWTLTDPRLIWPGLRLRLPIEPQDDGTPASDEPQPEEPTAPAEAPTPVIPQAPFTATPVPTPNATPTTAPATPVTTVAPVVVATPTPAATPSADDSPTAIPATYSVPVPSWAELHWSLLDLGWAHGSWPIPLGGVMVGAGLLLAGRYLRPRRAPVPRFETGIEVAEGFAQAVGGDEASLEEPLAALAEQVLDVARRHGCPPIRVCGAAAGRSRATLWFRVDADEALIQTVAEGCATEPGAVLLSRLPAGLLRWDQAWATVRPRPVEMDRDRPAVRLFPLGLAADRRVLYGERTGGAVLVADLPSAGVHQLLGALVVDRLRRQPPSELVVLTIASPDRLDPTLAAAPQQRMGFIDPADSDLVGRVLAALGDQLRERLDHPERPRPDILLVVDEWCDLPEAGATVDLLAEHGVTAGINLLAATTRVHDPSIETSVKLFRMRLVLQTPDLPASVRLLGRPGAEGLDRIGQAIPYLDAAVLARVRGFRVPPLYVEDLVARMRAQVAAEARPALFEYGGQATPLATVEDPRPAAEDDPTLDVDLPSEVPADATGTDGAAGPEPAETYEQAPLVRVVSMPGSRGPGPSPVPTSATASPPLVTAEFLGHDRILVSGSELKATEGVGPVPHRRLLAAGQGLFRSGGRPDVPERRRRRSEDGDPARAPEQVESPEGVGAGRATGAGQAPAHPCRTVC
jgi:hypothetical protein